MASFTFNSADVRAAANKIRTNLQNIEADIKGVETEQEKIQASWQGLDSENYSAKIGESAIKVKSLVAKLYDLATLLDKSADAVDNQQQANKAAVNNV